ncbi:hypothetical protein Bca52824_015630 [Brassica carinata]|uniref:Uncharacterized protein n=1 Tax=Brassica carinata TaxID=52824 RepID=A0A8X8B5Q6_BRACI|nr:hypothetical protein Bca52824_015630 [Brassica carinata]
MVNSLLSYATLADSTTIRTPSVHHVSGLKRNIERLNRRNRFVAPLRAAARRRCLRFFPRPETKQQRRQPTESIGEAKSYFSASIARLNSLNKRILDRRCWRQLQSSNADVGAVWDAMSLAVSHHAAAFADGIRDVNNCRRVTVVED